MSRLTIMQAVLAFNPHRRRILLLAALTYAAMC